jgi:hypothetical protein
MWHNNDNSPLQINKNKNLKSNYKTETQHPKFKYI